jgi:hypothetical protein
MFFRPTALVAIIVLSISAFLAPSAVRAASFGITPPYVTNDSLTRNSVYNQRIVLVRDNPAEDLNVEVTINVPGADKWFTIEPGMKFVMPSGSAQYPMNIRVNVPDNAKFGNITGNIRVVISPAKGPAAGTVGITLGAQIDVSLGIIDRKIVDLNVRGVTISNLEEGYKFWWMKVPGKIRFSMKLENKGNVDSAPDRVEFDIYDYAGNKLAEQTRNNNTIEKLKPFEFKDVVAELPTYLPPGAYRADYRIYKSSAEVAQQGQLDLAILPKGTLPDYQGYDLWNGLSSKDKATLAGLLFAILIILSLPIFFLVRRKKRHSVPRPPQS